MESRLDRLNAEWLAEARRTDRLVRPVYQRPQDAPGSEAWVEAQER